ncbi:glycoside hydrolase family 30 beta sandwich domain-containing protein [Microbacterium sp. SS28]|uniref:glycoside hydrolase family 30 protein n=1 Tax=Microbacterium sp. SS28 TaxID=2919948 RepID=UPI001FAA4E30|nr:glycoside hydrolase family 30 beta sandwich domain-containing protein [Microbacterium sp. SS28]
MQQIEARLIPDPRDDLDIVVDPASAEQEIVGFGAALTHSSAELIFNLPDDTRRQLLAELFSPDGDVRLSIIRVPIGASDFTPVEPFTLADVGPGETDPQLERFDLSPDLRALIPVLKEIVALAPDVTLVASPWSPPAWLKTSGSLEGGRLRDADDAYRIYADYLVRFVQEYRAEGIDIDYLTVQNEPQLRYPDGYPGTDVPFWQAAALIERLGPALREAGLATEILGFDHNWELSAGDAATTPAGEDPAYQYPADLLRTDAADWISGTAFHCYSGNAAAMDRLWQQFPQKSVWVSECSGSHGEGDSRAQIFADTLSWQSEHLLLDSLRNRASAILTWNLALDESGGPHWGGCTTCTGVVTVGAENTVERNAEYAVLGHAARFVPAGSVRVGSSEAPGLQNVAFQTPAGGMVMVIWNPGADTRDVRIGDGQDAVLTELAPRSLTTVAWGD